MADFVVLATADWDHPLWTNKQHTALTLAAAGGAAIASDATVIPARPAVRHK